MIKKKLWIMENLTFDSFQRYRLERYRACDIKIQGNDSVMVKYYTYLIIHFFRKRKISKEDPFSTQKFVHTAISLYKRYYLVNIYTEGFLLQNALCCIYLSLKMNQIPQEQIAKYSAAWKSKNEAFLSQQCVHFKEPGYNQKQLTLLRGIGFQIGRSPLIPAIQSLYHELKQSIQSAELLKQILDFMLEMLRRIYLDEKAIFLFEGPKLGLAIVLHTLQQKQKQSKLSLSIQNLLGTQIWSLIQREKIEVLGIVDYIAKIAKLEQKVISAEAKQLKDKIIKCKKKTFEVPQKKSPKISPVNYELFDEKRLQN